MKILNRPDLERSEKHRLVLDVLEEGLKSADPYTSTIEALSSLAEELSKYRRKIVIGFGKASYRMALASERFLDEIWAGGIIVPKGSVKENELKKIRVYEGTHPIPSQINVEATKEVLSLLSDLTEEDLVICLISGGGSALFVQPDGVSLSEKQEITRLLLSCGANIHEINCIRKHLSTVKGGNLARLIYPANGLCLILSDVVGDDVDTIASGPTSPDNTRFVDAWRILEKYRLLDKVPKAVIERIKMGMDGKIPETPKANDLVFKKIKNIIIANNMKALSAMAEKANKLGLKPMIVTSYLEGEAREVGKVIGSIARQILKHGSPINPPCILLFGGETTVTVKGNGVGGRNQELALSVAMSLSNAPNVIFASIGSDGVDGNSNAAGAIVDGETLKEAEEAGLSPSVYLENNDSNSFFERLRRAIHTGPTGTNVNDLAVLAVF
ncbi:MAG: glycerate kinase [Thermoproteota archaeon]